MIPARHRPPEAGSPRLCSGQAGEAGGFVISVVEATLVKVKILEAPSGGSPRQVHPDFYSLVICEHLTIFQLIKVEENCSNSQDERSIENAHDTKELNTTQNCKEQIDG